MEKKKIAIMVREQTARTCIAKGCLNALHLRKDAFARYAGCDVELGGFCHDGGPSDDPIENLRQRMAKFKKSAVDVVHLSSCIRSKNPCYDEMMKILSEEFEVVGYTHGPAERKNRKEKKPDDSES